MSTGASPLPVYVMLVAAGTVGRAVLSLGRLAVPRSVACFGPTERDCDG